METKVKRGVFEMTTANLSGLPVMGNSNVKAGQVTANKSMGGKKSADDVLAYLREMMPGWTITTSSADWGEGFRNIEIDRDILQRMANDPKEMEKYKALLLSFEDTVTELEKWGQENPGHSIILGFAVDAEGNTSATAVIKTLMGTETNTVFKLPDDKSTWVEFIRERLESLNQGQVEDAFGLKSWMA